MEFLDSSDFGILLQAKLFIGSLVLVFMFLFARRNPTDYDTQFQKRFRYALGIICCLLIVGCIILMINGPLPFAQSSYFLSLYGTPQPNDAMIQYGISPHNIIRPSDAYCFLGRQTFEQWCLGHDLCQIIALLALAIYFFSMKKSSVKWYVKVRKCIGYAMLLNAPGQLDGLHYLDRYELIPLLIYALVTYLLVRTYKKDAKDPIVPNESQYDNTEFEIIAPEQEIKTEIKESKVKKVRIRKPINWRKLLLCLIAFFTLVNVVTNIFFVDILDMEEYIPLIFTILQSILILVFGTYYMFVNKRKQIKNHTAYHLSWYINISTIISNIIFLIVTSFAIFDADEFYIWSLLLLCSLAMNIPMLCFVSNKVEQEYSFDYLVPQWLKASIKKYLKNMAAMRACVVFLIYPTAYIATLPLGIFAGVYIIPAFGIFYLCIFISWIIEGRNTAIE